MMKNLAPRSQGSQGPQKHDLDVEGSTTTFWAWLLAKTRKHNKTIKTLTHKMCLCQSVLSLVLPLQMYPMIQYHIPNAILVADSPTMFPKIAHRFQRIHRVPVDLKKSPNKWLTKPWDLAVHTKTLLVPAAMDVHPP